MDGKEDDTFDASLSQENASPYHALKTKIELFDRRLESLRSFDRLSLTEFINRLPGYERLMPLLGQSIVDILHALLRSETDCAPRSSYDIMNLCEQKGLVPAPMVSDLGRHLVLIETGFENVDATDLLDIQKGLPRVIRLFNEFLDHCRGYLESK